MRKVLYLMGIMDDRDVEWLGKSGTAKYVPSGAVLIREGSAIEDVFIVLDGRLSGVSQSDGRLGSGELARG